MNTINYIVTSKCSLSINPQELKINNINILFYSGSIYVNGMKMSSAFIKDNNLTIYICNSIPAGICYDSEFNSFILFGCFDGILSEEYIKSLNDDLNKYFLMMSGIESFKNYIESYPGTKSLELRGLMTKAVSVLLNSRKNFN